MRIVSIIRRFMVFRIFVVLSLLFFSRAARFSLCRLSL
jgi:hypothetical protein